jgi:hypothetical protein
MTLPPPPSPNSHKINLKNSKKPKMLLSVDKIGKSTNLFVLEILGASKNDYNENLGQFKGI